MKSVPENFVCQRCGNCCRVEGYVLLTQNEVVSCAAHLSMDVEEFTKYYTRLTKYRTGLSLVERDNGACIFLSENGQCLIEPV